MGISRREAINGALERLYDVGFTMEPGFSEHGPMVAEAISTLGRNDEVGGWVDFYKAKRRHIPPPPPHEAIEGRDEAAWRGALGVYARTTDWLEFFRRELQERAWQATIRDWIPRLLDGYAGGLTHGLIRTAHAVRALPEDQVPTALEIDELARGLASWAGTYQGVAGDPGRHVELTLEETLRRLPRVDAGMARRPATDDRPASSRRALLLDDLPDFAATVESLRGATDVGAAISRHTALFARLVLAHAELRPIPLIQIVHSITAPVAMRNLLPYVPAERGEWVYGCLWRVSASIVARMARPLADGVETNPEIGEPKLGLEDLIGRAVEHRDEHLIKLTEALLREDRLCPDPIYRVAAEAALQRLPRWS